MDFNTGSESGDSDQSLDVANNESNVESSDSETPVYLGETPDFMVFSGDINDPHSMFLTAK